MNFLNGRNRPLVKLNILFRLIIKFYINVRYLEDRNTICFLSRFLYSVWLEM